MTDAPSPLFDESLWRAVPGFGDLTDVTYHHDEGSSIARVAFNRPEVRNAFRPQTLFELQHAFNVARDDDTVGVIVLTVCIWLSGMPT